MIMGTVSSLFLSHRYYLRIGHVEFRTGIWRLSIVTGITDLTECDPFIRINFEYSFIEILHILCTIL